MIFDYLFNRSHYLVVLRVGQKSFFGSRSGRIFGLSEIGV